MLLKLKELAIATAPQARYVFLQQSFLGIPPRCHGRVGRSVWRILDIESLVAVNCGGDGIDLFVLRGLRKLSVSGTIVGCPEVEGIIRHSTVLEDLKLFQSGLEFRIKRDVLYLDRHLVSNCSGSSWRSGAQAGAQEPFVMCSPHTQGALFCI